VSQKAVSDAPVRIRKASQSDVPLLLSLIRKLAEYERKSHEVASTEESLRDALFGERPVVEALLAYCPVYSPVLSDDEPVGFALYFETYSTFRGCRGIFLEDLFVEPRHRGQGFGTALLAATARLAEERGGWLQWLVLDWNEPAVTFYRRLGATRIEEWNSYKLQGNALTRLAML
jgi:GNAT superfamily N-acetyltransferase